MKLKSIDLMGPLFVGSVNVGKTSNRVQASAAIGLSCNDEETKFTVKCGGAIKILPFTSIMAYEPMESSPKVSVPFKAAPQMAGITKAQVSTPTGVVERE